MIETENFPAGLVFDDRFLNHDTGLSMLEDRLPYPFPKPIEHPSSPELVGRAKQLMDLAGVTDRMRPIDAYQASDEALLAFHTQGYLDRIAALNLTGGDAGAGAPMGVGSDQIARLSAGVMAAVDAVLTGEVQRAYALVRPPGHHAMASEGMGFCVYNNVVIAARHAQRFHGITRVAILDWDVHHGNGTQSVFFHDPDVLFISLHQDNLYPAGWGKVEQIGEDAGEGRTVNVPLPAGSGNAGYAAVFEQIVGPIIKEFAPELIIVSAGQDASAFDPLARMTLTTTAYRAMTEFMMKLAGKTSGGRLVVAQEGGYAAHYAPYCSAWIGQTLAGAGEGVLPLVEPYIAYDVDLPSNVTVGLDARESIRQVITLQSRYWSSLRS